MLTIADLQKAIAEGWTDDGYSGQFKASPSSYKHFDHALKHIRKAAQALENMTEAADHGEISFTPELIRKYVADIIISAVRLWNVSPAGPLAVDQAVVARMDKKIFPGAQA